MSHFAEIDENNIVLRVIVAEQDFINSGSVGDSFNWVQTSYNSNFRKRFAGPGDTWDPTQNAFIPPKLYPSWTWDAETGDWIPPVAEPADAPRKNYWHEGDQIWVTPPEPPIE